MNRFFANFPLPEPILGAIGLGLLLRWIVPVAALPGVRALAWIGTGLLLGGALLIIWATATASEVRIAEPDRLLTDGPYAWSRNPMYVGWLAVAIGLGLMLHSLWVLLLTMAAFLYLHGVEIPKEERALEAAFGDAYRTYRARVRRYL